MEKILFFIEGKLNISRLHVQLVLIIFLAAIFSKGAVIFHGYSSDDYVFVSLNAPVDYWIFFSQGRYISAASMWLFESIGVSISDMYFSLGILTLFLQAIFVVSVLRFVGVADLPSAALVGSVIVAHPYLTEIFTFRMALANYGLALAFSIVALELIVRNATSWKMRTLALVATSAMLFTYQVFLSYFAIAILFTLILGEVESNKPPFSIDTRDAGRDRSIALTVVSTLSVMIFISVTWATKAVGLTAGQTRANLIGFDKISERMEQILSSFGKFYWAAEPILPGWLKVLISIAIVISITTIFWRLLSGRPASNSAGRVLFTGFAILLLIPGSFGVIVPLGDWWPVPRIVSHISVIIGLFLLVGDSCMRGARCSSLKYTNIALRVIMLLAFIFLSNQMLSDQQRINQWDRMMANRIVSRLEAHPGFGNIKSVYINGGPWGYPAKLQTVEGDMNHSAFFFKWSKVRILTEVSGYAFQPASGAMVVAGEKYCMNRVPWPDADSITIDGDLAIICLKENK